MRAAAPAQPTTARRSGATAAPAQGGAARGAALRSLPVRATSRSVPTPPELRPVGASAAGRWGPAASRGRQAPYVLLLVSLLAATTLGLLVLNTAIAVDSLKVTAVRKENARRVEEVQRLERQVVEGSTPQQLAARATSAGLVPDGTAGYLVVQPDGSSTLRGTPLPARPPASSPAAASSAAASPTAAGPTAAAPAAPASPSPTSPASRPRN